MLTIRQLGAIFFLLYGLLIPILAPTFVAENIVASLAMIACCCVISFLLYAGRALLLNILIAFFVFKIYLTRPYVNIFLDKLEPNQLAYILGNNAYFNPDHAAVVYLSLLSLLVAWFFGLFVTQPKKNTKSIPWIFQQLDTIIFSLNWRFWLVLIFLSLISYQNPTDSWRSATGAGESAPLFAFGLFNTGTIIYACLAAFLISRQQVSSKIYYILLVPILIMSLLSVAGGGRGSLFLVFTFTLLFWIFLNSNRHITYVDVKRAFMFVLFIPFVILAGLVAQVLRPLLKLGIDSDVLLNVFFTNLNIFDPNNPLLDTLYFGITQLLYRLSALQEKFLVLNDQYINLPWLTFNPMHSFLRIINNLVPGDLFPEVININQLFHHIYFNEHINYASHMWGIQSTLYLYFGFLFSAIVVFFYRHVNCKALLKISLLGAYITCFCNFLYFSCKRSNRKRDT